jgi:hypothetical protein
MFGKFALVVAELFHAPWRAGGVSRGCNGSRDMHSYSYSNSNSNSNSSSYSNSNSWNTETADCAERTRISQKRFLLGCGPAGVIRGLGVLAVAVACPHVRSRLPLANDS